MKILLSTRAKGVYISGALIKYRNTPGSMSKKVTLLEHDEEYIIARIKEDNLLPRKAFRKKVIANIYFMLSGSWYRDAHKPIRACKYALKAFIVSPLYIFVRLLKKAPRLLKKSAGA